MKTVLIKYNPYRLKTDVSINGKPVKKNSRLNITNQRIQEWIDNLPEILLEECSTRDFELVFHGTYLDFEDIVAVSVEAKKRNINIKPIHKPAKEVKDKELALDEIFKEIQDGPFEVLKQEDVINAFNLAKSKEFEVNVVATMSAGKSTLINALLGKKLMPATQEACTATITKIHDNDKDNYVAEAFDQNGEKVITFSNLTYNLMEELNSLPNVSKIDISGNIPFVTSEESSLVLIDTPGPNNARDKDHKVKTYNMLSESSKTLVLYILNAQQLAVEDDDNLLSHVADSMKIGGRQSRDRFIFVINKMDEYWRDEDSVESAIQKVKDYLSDKGIENPNIYPLSAITALYIRDSLMSIKSMESDDDDDSEIEEAKMLVRRCIKKEKFHFEDYTPLTTRAKDTIKSQLQTYVENNSLKEQALIHSGIITLEEIIKSYVLKYSKTAKIKNIVDTFEKKLESERILEEAKKHLSMCTENKQELRNKINLIESKLDDGENVKHFRRKINDINYDKQIKDSANKIMSEVEAKITMYLKQSTKDEMSIEEAKEVHRKLLNKANTIRAKMKSDIEIMVNKTVKKNASKLLNEYKFKLINLVDELDISDEFRIDPFKLMEGNINGLEDIEYLLDGTTNVKLVKKVIGEYKDYDEIFGLRRWLNEKLGTDFDVDFEIIKVYADVEEEYVDGKELSNRFILPIQEDLYRDKEEVINYAKKDVKAIKELFIEEFDKLDKLLKEKLDELKKCTLDEKIASEKLKESKNRLEWIEKLDKKLNNILDI